MKKPVIIISTIVLVLAAGVLAYFFFFSKNLRGSIVLPYIAHQKPRLDPHLPASDVISDKMDEVVYDGLFNISANPSGITYEDGLGEYLGIDANNVVTVRLKTQTKWHSSFAVTMDKKKIAVSEQSPSLFAAQDLKFTLDRIKQLGSLAPDYILVSQAIENLDFIGPDDNGNIQFQFKGDRIWTESDVKEVLSFKILPANSDINASEYKIGTGPYLLCGQNEDVIYFQKNPAGSANIPNFTLKPFIDNSTFITELKNSAINVLLGTPFGATATILSDTAGFFHKSNISTCFFAVLFNADRLTLTQRTELRKLIYNKAIMERFFNVNTPQQRHIQDYKGATDNYAEYLNNSIFPSSSYYVEEQIVMPLAPSSDVDLSVLPDTIRIQTCLNYGYREELSKLAEVMNDPTVCKGKIKVTAVQNEEIGTGNYDAILVPINGYRSNFLFDLYDIFLRDPDFSTHKINLVTKIDSVGKTTFDEASFNGRNFFRIDLASHQPEIPDFTTLLSYVYNFMATREVGDKQAYAKFIDELDQRLAMGAWLFSLPSMTYFGNQFDETSIDLYGVASQLSTAEKWKERPKK